MRTRKEIEEAMEDGYKKIEHYSNRNGNHELQLIAIHTKLMLEVLMDCRDMLEGKE